MVSEQHIKMWERLDINTELLSKMVSAAVKRHEDVFKTQSNRPSSMGYFDNFWENLQTGRVEELQEVKKAKKPLVGTFCIFVPEESVTALGGACYGLCSGSPASIPEAEKELPRNICPLIKSAHGFKLLKACGYTQSADFIYGETTCEAKKKTWEILANHHPVHVMQIPQKKDKKSLELWKKEIEEFNEHIEEISGAAIINEESCIGHRYYKDNIDTSSAANKGELVDKMLKRYADIDCACFTPNKARIAKIKKNDRREKSGRCHILHTGILPYVQRRIFPCLKRAKRGRGAILGD